MKITEKRQQVWHGNYKSDIASWVNGLANLFSDLEIINNSRLINVLKYKII